MIKNREGKFVPDFDLHRFANRYNNLGKEMIGAYLLVPNVPDCSIEILANISKYGELYSETVEEIRSFQKGSDFDYQTFISEMRRIFHDFKGIDYSKTIERENEFANSNWQQKPKAPLGKIRKLDDLE